MLSHTCAAPVPVRGPRLPRGSQVRVESRRRRCCATLCIHRRKDASPYLDLVVERRRESCKVPDRRYGLVDLVLLYRSSTSSVVDEADEIADITLSWVPPPSSSAITDVGRAGNRDSIDTLSGLTKGRLMDADSARLRSSLLTSQARHSTVSSPLQDHLSLQASISPSESRTIALGVRCLSPRIPRHTALAAAVSERVGRSGVCLARRSGSCVCHARCCAVSIPPCMLYHESELQWMIW